MHRQARNLSTEEQLYAAALRALVRRAHSIYEMRQALERRATDERLIGRVLQRLKNENLLDDARYARQFVRFRAESRRQGRFRIARELRVRGVPDRHIEAALHELCSESDEAGLVRRRLQRRLKLLRGPLDERQLASLYRSLLRAGFPSEIVRAELRAVSRQDVPALADPLPPEE